MRDLRWWQDPLLTAWNTFDATGEAALPCTSCGTASRLERWEFEPRPAMGALAFRFGNFYMLRESLLRELAEIAGYAVSRAFETV
jgi:hypothetical protein